MHPTLRNRIIERNSTLKFISETDVFGSIAGGIHDVAFAPPAIAQCGTQCFFIFNNENAFIHSWFTHPVVL